MNLKKLSWTGTRDAEKQQAGFTLVELIVVMTIFVALFGIIVLNLSTVRSKASLASTTNVLIADIKDQQNKAMAGISNANASRYFGIYFEPNQYILFNGSTYSPSNPTNFSIPLDSTFSFVSVLFPGSQVVFIPGSGIISGFTNGQNTITITDSVTGELKTISINRLGTITGVN